MRVLFEPQIRKLRRTLRNWERDQIPFAASLALNDVAFQTRGFVINRLWPNSFPRARQKRLPNAIFSPIRGDARATKRRLRAQLYDRIDLEWLDAHIEGGTFIDRTIPTRKIGRTARGKIPRAQLPRRLKNSFKADLKGRGEAVWQRTATGLRLMYVDRESVGIRPVFPFYTAGTQFANSRWSRSFERAVTRALRTARR